jgi:hypothetical protein
MRDRVKRQTFVCRKNKKIVHFLLHFKKNSDFFQQIYNRKAKNSNFFKIIFYIKKESLFNSEHIDLKQFNFIMSEGSATFLVSVHDNWNFV